MRILQHNYILVLGAVQPRHSGPRWRPEGNATANAHRDGWEWRVPRGLAAVAAEWNVEWAEHGGPGTLLRCVFMVVHMPSCHSN